MTKQLVKLVYQIVKYFVRVDISQTNMIPHAPIQAQDIGHHVDISHTDKPAFHTNVQTAQPPLDLVPQQTNQKTAATYYGLTTVQFICANHEKPSLH